MLLAHDIAVRLGLSPRAVGTLGKTGLLTPSPVGTALVYDEEEVAALQAREQIPGNAPPAWIVRLSAPFSTNDETRPLAGWHESWDEDTKKLAASRYWRIADPASYAGEGKTALVALVSEFVVGVWNITGGSEFRGMAEFDLHAATPNQMASYVGHRGRRIKLGRGPVVLRYPA